MTYQVKSLRRLRLTNRPTTLKGIRAQEKWYHGTSTLTTYRGWFFGYSKNGSNQETYCYVICNHTYSGGYGKNFIVGEVIDDVDTQLDTFRFTEFGTLNYTLEFGAGAIVITSDYDPANTRAVALSISTDATTTDAGWLVGTTNSAGGNSDACSHTLWSEFDPLVLKASLTATADIPYARPYAITHEGVAALSATATVSAAGSYFIYYMTVKNYRWYHDDVDYLGDTTAYVPAAAINTPIAPEPGGKYRLRLHMKNESGKTLPKMLTNYIEWRYEDSPANGNSGLFTYGNQVASRLYHSGRVAASNAGTHSSTNWTGTRSHIVCRPAADSLWTQTCRTLTCRTINSLFYIWHQNSAFTSVNLSSTSYSLSGTGSCWDGPTLIAKDDGNALAIGDLSTNAQLLYNNFTASSATWGGWTALLPGGHAWASALQTHFTIKQPGGTNAGRIWVFFALSASATALRWVYSDDDGSTWTTNTSQTITLPNSRSFITIFDVVFCPTTDSCVMRYRDNIGYDRWGFYNGTSWAMEKTLTDPISFYPGNAVPSVRWHMTVETDDTVHFFRVYCSNSSDGDEETGSNNDLVVRHYTWVTGTTTTYSGGADILKDWQMDATAPSASNVMAWPGAAVYASNDKYVEFIYGAFGGVGRENTTGWGKIRYDLANDTLRHDRFYIDLTVANFNSADWYGELNQLLVGRTEGSTYISVVGGTLKDHIAFNSDGRHWRSAIIQDGYISDDTYAFQDSVLLGTDNANFRKDYVHQTPAQYQTIVFEADTLGYERLQDKTALANNAEIEVDIICRIPNGASYFTAWSESFNGLYRRSPVSPVNAFSAIGTNNVERDVHQLLDATDDEYIDSNGSLPTHWTATASGASFGATVVTGDVTEYMLQLGTGNSPAYSGFSWTWQGAASHGLTVSFMVKRANQTFAPTFTLYNETTSTQLDTFNLNPSETGKYLPVYLSGYNSGSVVVSNGDQIAIRISVSTGGNNEYIDRFRYYGGRFGTSNVFRSGYDSSFYQNFGLNYDTGKTPKYHYWYPTLMLTGTATVAAAGSFANAAVEGVAAATSEAFITAVGSYGGGIVTANAAVTGVATISPVATKGITDTIAAAISGAATLASAGVVYRTQQTHYRWRNDDGTETTATWAAATNAEISPQYNKIYRLRIGLYAKSATQIPPSHLEYRKNGTGAWKPIGGYQTAIQVPADRWVVESTIALNASHYATNGTDPIYYNGKMFFQSNNGRWHIFYSAIPSGYTVVHLMHMYSDNNGTSWSTPSVITHTQWDGFPVSTSRRINDMTVKQQPDGDLVLVYNMVGTEYVYPIGTYFYRGIHWSKSSNNGGTWTDSVETLVTGDNLQDIKLHVYANDDWLLTGKGVSSTNVHAFPAMWHYNGTTWYSHAHSVSPSGETLDYMAGEMFLNGTNLNGLYIGYDNTNNGTDGDYPIGPVTTNWPSSQWNGGTQDTPVWVQEYATTNVKQSSAYSCTGHLIRHATCSVEPDACSFISLRPETYNPGDTPKYAYGFYGKDGWFISSAYVDDIKWIDFAGSGGDLYYGNYGTHLQSCQGEDEHAIYKFHMNWYFNALTDRERYVQYGLTKGVYPPTECRTLGTNTDNEPTISSHAGIWMDGSSRIVWDSSDSKYRVISHEYQDTDMYVKWLDTAAACQLRGTNNFDATTQQITSGTYQSSNKGMAMWGVAECRWHTIPADTYVEYEYYLQTAAENFGAVSGDYVELRVYGIDDYVQLPTITFVREKASLVGVATINAEGFTDGPKSAVTATAALSAVGEVAIPGVAALQGAAALAALSKMDRLGAVGATGAATLAPAGHVDREAQVALAGAATVQLAATNLVYGASTVSASATTSWAEPVVEVRCRVSLVGRAYASGSSSAERPASASLLGEAFMGLRSGLCVLPGHVTVYRPANELTVWKPAPMVVSKGTLDVTIERTGVPEVVVYKAPTPEVTV